MPQLSYFLRQLDVESAAKRVAAQLRASGPRTGSGTKSTVELSGMVAPIRSHLEAAAGALKALKEASGYHWVDLGQLFGVTVQ